MVSPVDTKIQGKNQNDSKNVMFSSQYKPLNRDASGISRFTTVAVSAANQNKESEPFSSMWSRDKAPGNFAKFLLLKCPEMPSGETYFIIELLLHSEASPT